MEYPTQVGRQAGWGLSSLTMKVLGSSGAPAFSSPSTDGSNNYFFSDSCRRTSRTSTAAAERSTTSRHGLGSTRSTSTSCLMATTMLIWVFMVVLLGHLTSWVFDTSTSTTRPHARINNNDLLLLRQGGCFEAAATTRRSCSTSHPHRRFLAMGLPPSCSID